MIAMTTSNSIKVKPVGRMIDHGKRRLGVGEVLMVHTSNWRR